MSQPPYPPPQPEGQPGHAAQPGPHGRPDAGQSPSGTWSAPPPPPPAAWGAPQQSYSAAADGPPQPPAPQRRGRGRLLAAAVAVVVVAGGGIASYVAFSDSGSNNAGAGSPQAAVNKLVTDLNNSDFIGVLDDLAPGEKAALADPVRADIAQLKRLNVLKSDADPSKVAAVTFHASGLTFADRTTTVNDHVRIVTVTGGTLRVSADASRVPLTAAFVAAAFGKNAPTGTSVKTANLAELARTEGSPLMIATQQVNGRWYPSLFYTIAQNAAVKAGLGSPDPGQRIPDSGAGSPEGAVRGLLDALLAQDWRRAIGYASPTELGVLHDYGPLLLKRAPRSTGKTPFTISSLTFTSADISGGKRLTLTSLDATVNGQPLHIAVSAGCFDISVAGQQQKFCGSQLIDLILAQAGSFGGAADRLTAAQKQALTHVIDGVASVGVDVSQSGGKWYVSGARTIADELGSLLSKLQGNDLLELATLLRGH